MDYNSPRFSTIFLMICLLCCYKLNMDRINISPFVSTKHQPNLKFWCFKFQGCRFWCSRFEISRSLFFMECCEVQNPKWVLWTHLKNRRSVVFFVCAADGWAGVRCTFLDLSFNITVPFYARLFCSLFVFLESKAGESITWQSVQRVQ